MDDRDGQYRRVVLAAVIGLTLGVVLLAVVGRARGITPVQQVILVAAVTAPVTYLLVNQGSRRAVTAGMALVVGTALGVLLPASYSLMISPGALSLRTFALASVGGGLLFAGPLFLIIQRAR